ncbi:SAM-dependent methyltransferase [Ramlibacter sp.]|uniref:SAM-dependent methyltransferase n=1 Tax=Ramlibacter sp. TaxID=1917967 RepID=UPI002D420D8A|nr:SAM-dependent methyltransferase [Ramlibacter sp.]HYD74840.1 SAM-dependent methyltransferase [Ramlibacter sp.]
MAAAGTLFLVPAPLDFGCPVPTPLQQVMPAGTLEVAARLGHWIAENARTTRAYLKRVGEIVPLAQPLQALAITELPRDVHKKGDHSGGFDARPLLGPALQGHDIGLVSEAGMPAVADPGSSVVRAAHQLGIRVVPLVGPVSLLLALAASGLNGQSFAFVGYLPQQPGPRTQRIRELEALALRTGQTQLFIETPYRNTALWQSLLDTLRGDTRLGVAAGLTLPDAHVAMRTAGQWKREAGAPPADTPAVFLIGG